LIIFEAVDLYLQLNIKTSEVHKIAQKVCA